MRTISRRGAPPYSERKRQEQLTEHRTTNKGHGRLEKRHLQASTRVVPYLDWPGAQQVCRIERTITRDGKKTSEVVYAITSLPPELADARLLLQLNRGHWSIENKLHWIRDAVMLEDKCRAKKGHSPQNLAALRNLGLTIIRQAGIKAIKAATRQFAYNSTELLKKLRIIN